MKLKLVEYNHQERGEMHVLRSDHLHISNQKREENEPGNCEYYGEEDFTSVSTGLEPLTKRAIKNIVQKLLH